MVYTLVENICRIFIHAMINSIGNFNFIVWSLWNTQNPSKLFIWIISSFCAMVRGFIIRPKFLFHFFFFCILFYELKTAFIHSFSASYLNFGMMHNAIEFRNPFMEMHTMHFLKWRIKTCRKRKEKLRSKSRFVFVLFPFFILAICYQFMVGNLYNSFWMQFTMSSISICLSRRKYKKKTRICGVKKRERETFPI